MVGYLIFSLISILLLTLREEIEIKYVYDEGFFIKFTFSVIELTLWNFKKKAEKKSNLRKRLRGFISRKRGYDYVLSHSDINIDRIYLHGQSGSSFKDAVALFGSFGAVASLAVAYLEAGAATVTKSENALTAPSNSDFGGKSYISITQNVRVFHLLSGLLIGSKLFQKYRKRGFING